MSDTDPNEPMSLNDMRKIVMFLMSKLSPADLEELDGQMLGQATPMVGDVRFGDDATRARFLQLGPRSRNAVREGYRSKIAADGHRSRSLNEMFPNLNRLGG